ncbi:hypothetical protein D1BOALGB6SA_9919 [Olavius sp. associated proteobacterium Delta 1]|nr:hypothetical protein D1BOALGB6SA_9919 [Olavius sp. associated proteobacterium Delta 1]
MNESRIIFIEYFIAFSIVVIWFASFHSAKNWKKWANRFLILLWASFFAFIAYEQFERIPIYSAITSKDFKKVNLILTEKPKLINYRTLLGRSVIHAAVRNDATNILRLLIKKNAEINVEDWNSATPLHLAAETGNTDILVILVENGANIEARAYKPKMTPLQVAAFHGNLPAVKILVEKGAEVNAKYSDSQTTVGFAKKYKHIEIKKLTREGTTTYYDQVTSRVLSKETVLPLSTLKHIKTKRTKQNEYAAEICAFSDDGTLLGEFSDTFQGGTFFLLNGYVLVEDKLQDFFDEASTEDPEEFEKKMETIALDKRRVNAVEVLIDDNMIPEAVSLLSLVSTECSKGEKEVLPGYIFAMQGNCAKSKKMFDKALSINPNVCIPKKYKDICEY